MAEKRSCASRLHQIQRDVGISDKELRSAVKDITRPREVQLPVLREKPSKKTKREKEHQVGAKKRKYFLAHWYLEKYLKPEYAKEVYLTYLDFHELVDYAYNEALALIQLITFVKDGDLDPRELIPDPPMDELDIPEVQWKEFSEYCKTHPLKHGAKDIFTRRRKFKKWRYKRRGRYYSKRRMRMYDPLFAMTVVDEKEMIRNLERISKENELRVKKFHEMIESLIPNTAEGSMVLKRFDQQTKEIQKRHRQRTKEFMKQHGYRPTTVTLDMDDEPPRVFD